MINREIYVRDPKATALANNGVAEISSADSAGAEAVLRYELETFVCEGQYESGLSRILRSFLDNLDRGAEQPGVWISGFYGSGKSHLAKMLSVLWVDRSFGDGTTARSIAKLPSEVSDHLRELSHKSKQSGGLHAAAGKLGSGSSGHGIRLELASLVFESAGLPRAYHQARFVLWLKREGLFDSVVATLDSDGRTLRKELQDLTVSRALAGAVLDAQPDLAESVADFLGQIRATYPQVSDISNDDLIASIEDALMVDGELPLTLVVLDEVQQFIGANGDAAYSVQEATETLTKHFNGKLIFVATGQNALSGTSQLQKIRDRFALPITLGDQDVENVTRKIILAKKTSAVPAIDVVGQQALGELSRHLQGTKLEHDAHDEQWFTPDYPVLPVRRRFWELVLRSLDVTGTDSQLRSQLRVMHEAVLSTADDALGTVVGADFLYDQLAGSLIARGLLTGEVDGNIRRLESDGDGGELKARLLKLIALVNWLPPERAIEQGIHATEHVLADLTVTYLSADSTPIRSSIGPALAALRDVDHLVISLSGARGEEYRLQTDESRTWEAAFRAAEGQLLSNPAQLASKRADLLRAKISAMLPKQVMHGKGSVARPIDVSFAEAIPGDHGTRLYVLVRTDAPSATVVQAEASALQQTDPTVFVYVPDLNRTHLDSAITTKEAAATTLAAKGIPATEDGREASRSVEGRGHAAGQRIDALVDGIVTSAQVFIAGGTEITSDGSLSERVRTAVTTRSLSRLYTDFDHGDDANWGKALIKARDGDHAALAQVGYQGEGASHPVLAKVLGYIGAGKTGADIRGRFETAHYGWSRDAVDTAIYFLILAGHLRGTAPDGTQLARPQELSRTAIGAFTFRVETVQVSPQQVLTLRAVLTASGVKDANKKELLRAPELVPALRARRKELDDEAPAPRVEQPTYIAELEQLSGNELAVAIVDRKIDIETTLANWAIHAKDVAQRRPAWEDLSAMLVAASTLSELDDVRTESQAILDQRSLLAQPDPVPSLLNKASTVVRDAITERQSSYSVVYATQLADLESDDDWLGLDITDRRSMLVAKGIAESATVPVATVKDLRAALAMKSLDLWDAQIAALPARFAAVRQALAKRLEPAVVSVSLPKRIVRDEAELKSWLTDAEQKIRAQLTSGPVSL